MPTYKKCDDAFSIEQSIKYTFHRTQCHNPLKMPLAHHEKKPSYDAPSDD
jgi:hypothetical protein